MSPKAKKQDSPAIAQEPPFNEENSISLEEQREVMRLLRLRRSQIPPHFVDKTLKGFETRGSETRKQMVQMAREYIDSFCKPEWRERPGAILHGTTGSGKTHILCAILMELMSQGHDVLFYSVPNLFKEIRATYDSHSEVNEDDLIDRVSKVKLLALDDLGAEKTSDWVLDRLYLIINERYCNGLPTLITTNHDWPDDLEKAVGRRITSRLAEMCRIIGPFPSEDWRMKSAGLKRRLA